MAESMSFVLFIIALALLGYASYLKVRSARIEKNAKNAKKRIARHEARIAEWIAYADYLESELAHFSTEYAGVRLDYDISRGKVKAAPVKTGNGAKAYALTLPGMAIPSDCDVLFEESPERAGALIVHRKPEQKNKNGAKLGDSDKSNVNAAKSEKPENSPDSSAKNSNGAKSDSQALVKTREECKTQLKRDLTSDEESWLVTKVIDWELASKQSGNIAEYTRRAMGKFAPKTGKK